MCRFMLFELSETSEALEVPSEKPDNWRSQCSEILMQEVNHYMQLCNPLNLAYMYLIVLASYFLLIYAQVRPLDDASIFFLASPRSCMPWLRECFPATACASLRDRHPREVALDRRWTSRAIILSL